MSEANSNSLHSLVGLSGFRCIVADPPWAVKFGEDHHRDRRASTGSPKGTWSRPRMDYPTMTLAEIEAMPVAGVADKDAHLYLWTINRYVEQAYSVARAWGFRPVCLLTWAKTPRGLGLGGAFVQTTEHILFARRGTLKALHREPSTWWNWTRPEAGTGPKHSRKPEDFQTLVEAVSPGPRLELFARRARPGWVTLGNEADGLDMKDSLILLAQGKHPCYGVEKHGESRHEQDV